MTAAMIRRLSDRADILDVVTAYTRALDTKDWGALASLFTDDARWEYPGHDLRPTGPDAIVALVGEGLRRLDATQHLIGNHLVTVDGDVAAHSCYFQAQHVRRGFPGGETFLGAGRYDDSLRRTSEGWRFTHRTLTPMWSEGNPDVLK